MTGISGGTVPGSGDDDRECGGEAECGKQVLSLGPLLDREVEQQAVSLGDSVGGDSVTFSDFKPFFSQLSPKCPLTCQHEHIS